MEISETGQRKGREREGRAFGDMEKRRGSRRAMKMRVEKGRGVRVRWGCNNQHVGKDN